MSSEVALISRVQDSVCDVDAYTRICILLQRVIDLHSVQWKCEPTSSNCTGWLGGIMVRALDLQSSSRGFDSRSGRYQAT